MNSRSDINTEFSLPEVKAAPVEYVVLERCETGRDIRRRRARAVNAASVEAWWAAEGKGWLEYCEHVKACDQCKTFDIARRVHRGDLPVEEK